MSFKNWNIVSVSLMLIIFISACSSEKKTGDAIFEVLDNKRTGLDFSNDLSYNKEFNLFKYMYFYNGSGVGAGDFNNDGLIDLFFGSNQHQNKIYLNKGGLQFKDVTNEAKIPQDGGWSTGISVVDINNDGLLDIYVCRVGDYEILHSKNQLLINQGIDKNGIPVFIDSAKEYGLDFSGFSTQAAFFDYDMDGDLDMYLLNHSVHENGSFRPRKDFAATYHPLAGDRIYRNDITPAPSVPQGGKVHTQPSLSGNILINNDTPKRGESAIDTPPLGGRGAFTDVTKETGINSSAIGYGLGIAIADINIDGYPDIYIGNDFHENDYLYINQKNGTFKDQSEEQLMHTSKFSMGVDVADVNNDAFPEIISMDMLPSDPYNLKRSLGDDYDIFNYKIRSGYTYQYTRNNLQYNRKNGMFSETGLYSGIAATDWSWAPLWVDFDNDGLKDLFVSNGIPKRMNDIDYINFVSNGEIQKKILANDMEKDMSLINKFPEIILPNKFFSNKGELSFADEEMNIENNQPTFSNGAVYADFDNDGDPDIVVNNIDDPALLYENKTADTAGKSLQIILKGSEKNKNAVGARIILYANNEIRTYEKFPVKGFLSSMEIPLQIGLKNTKVDSAFLIWPDNTYQQLSFAPGSKQIKISYSKNLPPFDFNRLQKQDMDAEWEMEDITKAANLNFLHQENHFGEFDREPLIPHMISTEGPALAVADINKDGLEDVFIGSARNKKSTIFLQEASGKFIQSAQTVLDNDSSYEDVSACWADMNNDGNIDLVVASGGNEFYGRDQHNTPRIYLNDGKANFTRLQNPFDSLYITASCVVPNDFNGDGFMDLFIGARAVPWEYGQVPKSYLLLNDKKGKFIDVTNTYAEGLSNAGFVTQALWFDIDKDGDKDLLISLEWGELTAFINNKARLTGSSGRVKFTKKLLSKEKGWWNFMLPYDFDNDGDIDLVAGNLGLNSRLKASEKQPVRLYYNDFDGNGKKEQVLTYYVNEKEIPFASKAELEKQIPLLKKKFLYAENFARAALNDLFTTNKLKKAEVSSADYFSNAIFINKGNLEFATIALPWQAQLTSFKDAVIVNANDDDLPDILLMGNYYDNNIEMGRYDADFGTVLINKGKGSFACQTINGLIMKGQVRHIKPIAIGKQQAYILVRNNDSAMIVRFDK